MKDSLRVGSRLPAYASSVGKLLLSYLPEQRLERYFSRADLNPLTEKTITNEDALREDLAQIRKNGWALNVEELEIGLISMAAPVKDGNNNIVAAVNCLTHSGKCSLESAIENYLPELLNTASQISERIDYEII